MFSTQMQLTTSQTTEISAFLTKNGQKSSLLKENTVPLKILDH